MAEPRKNNPTLVYIVLALLVVAGVIALSKWRGTTRTPDITVPQARPINPPVMPQQPTEGRSGSGAAGSAPRS